MEQRTCTSWEKGLRSRRAPGAAIVAALTIAALLSSAAPARADHILVETLTASSCKAGRLICATIQQEWRYHDEPGNSQFTVTTLATGGSILPGRLEASYTWISPADPQGSVTGSGCNWSIPNQGCTVKVGAFGIAATQCFPNTFRLFAATRALNDPTSRLLTAVAMGTWSVTICPGGVLIVTPVPG